MDGTQINAPIEHWCGQRQSRDFPTKGPDSWDTNRWIIRSREESAAAARAYEVKHVRKDGTQGAYASDDMDSWYGAWVPRTCSYCGGIHPEDALKLMDEGWRIEGTTKSYKRYMQPPASLKPWSMVPPVKIYFQDWTSEQGDLFNSKLAAAKPA